MSGAPMFETGAVVLGYVGLVASWRRVNPASTALRGGTDYTLLTIQVASSSEDGMHVPAESVTLSGRAALAALRGAIDEALKEGSTP